MLRLAALLALLVTGFARAELPVARLDTIFPPGGKAGSVVEATITGNDLDGADTLCFSAPGITAALKSDKHFDVTISSEVRPGIYDVRVAGALGVSNPRCFVVGDLPEVVAKAPHDKLESAIEFPLGTTVNGATTAAAADYFRFAAKRGDRVLVICSAADIDSRLIPEVALLDTAGLELATSRKPGLLDFTAPADATYLVRLHDLTFAGGADHFYRLAVTTGPYLDFILPVAVQAGTKAHLTVFGRNLSETPCQADVLGSDGKPLQKLETDIDIPSTADHGADGLSMPAAAIVEGFSYRLSTPRGASNPLFISFAAAPVTCEAKPSQDPAQPQQVTPPCDITGQFCPANHADTYAFTAKKGEVLWLEAFSHRLGLPTNPFLLVQRDAADLQEVYGSDANIGAQRFSTVTYDPAWRFEVKDDGLYRVRISDLFGNTRRDPDNVYRLSLRKESPDFGLVALVEPPPSKADDRSSTPRGALLRGGGALAIKVLAYRRDNFAGEIELSAEDLPPGVACCPTKILAGKNDGLLLLTATESAAHWVGVIRILGKAHIGDRDAVHEARSGTVSWSVPDYNNDPVPVRLARQFMLAVSGTETAPIGIEPAEDKVWEAAPGTKLEIPLEDHAARRIHGGPQIESSRRPGDRSIPGDQRRSKGRHGHGDHRSRRAEAPRWDAHHLLLRPHQRQIP